MRTASTALFMENAPRVPASPFIGWDMPRIFMEAGEFGPAIGVRARSSGEGENVRGVPIPTGTPVIEVCWLCPWGHHRVYKVERAAIYLPTAGDRSQAAEFLSGLYGDWAEDLRALIGVKVALWDDNPPSVFGFADPSRWGAHEESASEMRTGEEWRRLLYPDYVVLDADGWRCRGWNMHFTNITQEEFQAAFLESTIIGVASGSQE